MSITRRSSVEWAASMAALAASARVRSDLAAATLDDRGAGFRPELLPSQQAVWDQQVWMAGLGPKYTGNTAHTRFVDFSRPSSRRPVARLLATATGCRVGMRGAGR